VNLAKRGSLEGDLEERATLVVVVVVKGAKREVLGLAEEEGVRIGGILHGANIFFFFFF